MAILDSEKNVRENRKGQSRMNNHRTQDTRHMVKVNRNTTQKTNKMSFKNPTNKMEMKPNSCEV